MSVEKLLAKDFFEPGRIPLCVFRMPYVEWSRKSHSHDFHEVMIVLGGMAIHHFGDSEETISMGDVFVIPPDYPHGYEVVDKAGVQVLNVLFDLDQLKMNIRDLDQVPGFHALFSIRISGQFEPHLKLQAKELAYINSIIEEIEEEQEGMLPGWEFACQTKFRALVLFLSRRYSHVAAQSGRNMLKMGEIVAYLERNLMEELRFEGLAEVAHMSPTTLRRVFRETFGCSPMAYLQQLRVKKSMLLLANPAKSISDVAFEVGFNDSGYFSRVFRQETGESPKEFRSRLA
jgi:AraC-like DNA-binding protein